MKNKSTIRRKSRQESESDKARQYSYITCSVMHTSYQATPMGSVVDGVKEEAHQDHPTHEYQDHENIVVSHAAREVLPHHTNIHNKPP
jgi:hypothetical protein